MFKEVVIFIYIFDVEKIGKYCLVFYGWNIFFVLVYRVVVVLKFL